MGKIYFFCLIQRISILLQSEEVLDMEEQKALTRRFTRKDIENLLSASVGHTLEQVDKAGLFVLHEGKSKVTGIAGDIVEISVLGCERDSKQEPDIVVDGVQVELKTTGLIKPKKKDSPYPYECKEPVSITAVSIPVIVGEEFETSKFWHKLAHVLWVYYWYKSPVTVKLDGYKDFPILGFQFYEFDETDRLRLKQDWLSVRDFLIVIHRDYPSQADREAQYPRLSHELRSQLMLIDTAPKYPNPPRFRLKRSFATVIANACFSKKKFEKLAAPIIKYTDIDAKCEKLNKAYTGKTFAEIAKLLNVPLGKAKNFAELVVLKMFGGESKSLNKIEDFAKISLLAKSLPLSHTGVPKESMKMFTPDFEEWVNEDSFEESFLRDYFAEHQFLFIVYQYQDKDERDVSTIRFVGFKRVVIPDVFIDTEVKKCWTEVRSLIKGKRLIIEKKFRKDGMPVINPKSGVQQESPNFPKEKTFDVFLRGSGGDSSDKYKTLEINGLRMLPQEVWLSKRATLDFYLNQKL